MFVGTRKPEAHTPGSADVSSDTGARPTAVFGGMSCGGATSTAARMTPAPLRPLERLPLVLGQTSEERRERPRAGREHGIGRTRTRLGQRQSNRSAIRNQLDRGGERGPHERSDGEFFCMDFRSPRGFEVIAAGYLSRTFSWRGTLMGADDKIGNMAEEATGTAKKAVGRSTADRGLEAEGRADQAKGNVKQSGEKLKDMVKSLFRSSRRTRRRGYR